MSLNSLANAAYARRTDLTPINRVPSTVDEIARAARTTPLDAPESPEMTASGAAAPLPPSGAATSVDTAMRVLFGYIPAEVLTVYVAVMAAVQTPLITVTDWIVFGSFFAATPLVVWLLFAAKVTAAGKQLPLSFRALPIWEMFAATLAFTAWALGLPHSPFGAFGWYSAALSGLSVLIVSTILGLLAPFFQRPLSA